MAEPRPYFLIPPSRPKLRLPSGAADTHVHVFGPHRIFPFAENRPFTPADAPKEKLFALHAMLGVELVPPTVDDAELRRLDSQGFCGVRFNFMSHLGKGAGIEEAIALTPRLAKLGWHLQVHFEGSLIDELAPWFERSAVPVVIDHMGRVDASLGIEQPAFRRLLDLMRDSRFRVKVSGSERISRRPPPWEDAIPFARTLVAEFGDRCFWGSDWPHPNLAAVPDDGVLVDLLAEIAPSEKERKALMVDNPRRFYRFSR